MVRERGGQVSEEPDAKYLIKTHREVHRGRGQKRGRAREIRTE